MKKKLSRAPQKVAAQPSPRAVDMMDAGLDLLAVAEIALRAESWVDRETIAAVSNTIHQALKQLRPAREIINSNLL
jgi:hypothetical protein